MNRSTRGVQAVTSARRTTPDEAEVATVATRRLLVVDDDPRFARVVAAVATTAGFEATAVSTLETIVPALSEPYDGVLLDLEMPELDGVEVLRILSRARPGARVILVSGFDAQVLDTASRVAKGWGLDVVRTIEKPCGAEVLRSAFRALVAPRASPCDLGATSPVLPAEEVDALVAAGHVVAHLQPKVRLADRAVVGFEALARIDHPEHGLLGPLCFLPSVAATPAELRLDLEVLRQAAAFVVERGAGTLSVNVSPALLEGVTVPRQLAGAVRERGLDPRLVTVELVEDRPMTRLVVLDAAARLRLLGFGLSLDDFGTGWANLAGLGSVPFTELKIDRHLVQGAVRDPRKRGILENTVDLARRVGVGCVAEGVEDEACEALLREIGCEFAQGWLYGCPVPAEEALARWPVGRVGA